jgi:hypothetical protein
VRPSGHGLLRTASAISLSMRARSYSCLIFSLAWNCSMSDRGMVTLGAAAGASAGEGAAMVWTPRGAAGPRAAAAGWLADPPRDDSAVAYAGGASSSAMARSTFWRSELSTCDRSSRESSLSSVAWLCTLSAPRVSEPACPAASTAPVEGREALALLTTLIFL